MHACILLFALVMKMLIGCQMLCNGMAAGGCIAANHSDFGGILPLFTQYSAIPIGMTKFRQN